jgi:tripartite ATP-independent transporter DctM subunit
MERGEESTFSVHEVMAALRGAVWEILLPVVVLGGIFSGILVLSEAAAITALYVLVMEMVIHRELGLRDLAPIVTKTVMMVGGIVLILGASLAFNAFLIDRQIPHEALTFIQEQVTSKLAFLLILNIFLLAVGCVLDVFSALVIVVPLIMPMAASYDIHPVHLGIIFLANLQIGYSTPPIGMNLFLAALRFERPMLQLYRASLPFLLLLLMCLAIVTFVPSLSLIWL